MRKASLLAICLMCAFLANAQAYKKKFSALFDESPGWPQSGWLAAAGVTHSFSHAAPGSQLTGTIKPSSPPGIYLELGRFHVVPSGIIFNNVDYSVAFRQLKYGQEMEVSDASGNILRDRARRTDNNISLNFNLNSIIQFSDFQWIQPSLGIHGDYRLGGRQTSSFSDPGSGSYVPMDSKVNVQLHAKIAYGAKITSELFIVPTLEVGLWRVNDFSNIRIDKRVFNSKYVPVIFSVKFLLQRPISMKPCNIKVEEVDLTKMKRRKKRTRLF